MMSDPSATLRGMIDPAENAARLAGLCAMLSLPMVRCDDGRERRRKIEIEVSPGMWAEVHGISFEGARILMWSGNNGSRIQYEFKSVDGCPRWRTEKPTERRYLIDDEARSER